MILACRTIINLLSTYNLQDICVVPIIVFAPLLPADIGILGLYQNL